MRKSSFPREVNLGESVVGGSIGLRLFCLMPIHANLEGLKR
jgi:hypothetical protein